MSRGLWEQMTLAFLIVAATWDSFWQSIMPSSQTALHLLASMEPLVLSSSSRALLALVWSSTKSTRGLMLPLPEPAAMGEMLLGTSPREASPSLILAWDEVSAGWGRSSGFHGGDVKITAVVGLLGDECWDSQLDASNDARDRLLTSMVILPSDLGRLGILERLHLLVWFLHWGWRDINSQVDMFACDKAYTTVQQLW